MKNGDLEQAGNNAEDKELHLGRAEAARVATEKV
jgi:hypothetical protein